MSSFVDIYPRSRTAYLDDALFRSPPAEYRGTPFWSWNNKLDRAQLFRQIAWFKEMGLGGFHMHPRTGLETPYLGPEFMDLIRACVEQAKSEGMLAWLYDEDRWPSGFAGGLVTRDERFRARHLLFTCTPYERGVAPRDVNIAAAHAGRTGKGTRLARYEIDLRAGYLERYRLLPDGEEAAVGSRVWHAYLEVAQPSTWFNNQTYVDTLNPDAIRRFLEVTHACYAEAVGSEFGKTVPAIFTDEPQFVHKQCFTRADDRHDIVIPWTDDLPDTFRAAYGQDLIDALPELFWELPEGRASRARYRYHDHVCERFTEAFADTVGGWCEAHGIALTGHMMSEPSLLSQTAALGEAMRSYRAFHMPGIDMLCDSHEYTTAKQAQSAAHQFGRAGVMSELYGVTNWDFDFAGHKGQGDWQAALGVTVRVPHLAWVSMAGEAKRDYPASISYQSPWFREYPLIEDHFARLNTALTRGTPVVRIGVIHPIESFWLCFGPAEQTALERVEREGNFVGLTWWLLFGLLDFDFISESLLPALCPAQEGNSFQVGAMQYDVVLVPGMRTIRATTLERLEAFAEAGGRIVFVGEIPSLVDAVPDERARRLAARCRAVPFQRSSVAEELAPFREIQVRCQDDLAHLYTHQSAGQGTLLHHLRRDGDRRILFVCNSHRFWPHQQVVLTLNGTWDLTLLDTHNGERTPLPAQQENGSTMLTWDFPAYSHLLLEMTPSDGEVAPPPMPQTTPVRWVEQSRLPDPVPVTLSEPNVLLLDQAQYCLDDGAWQDVKEVLRVENVARAHWGLPPKRGEVAQPWTDTEPVVVAGHLRLKFAVESDVAVVGARLALEAPETTEVYWDGQSVGSGTASVDGWWVDEAIQTLPLPDIAPGTHFLELRIAFTRKTNVEWCYLLGDFGVQVQGRRAKLTAPVRALSWGDWTTQGLPFYAGSATYHCLLDATGQETALHIPHFRAPLLSVEVDGRPAAKIAFAPFRAVLREVAAGRHALDITAYGNRVNAFGALHNVDPDLRWFGPSAWRSTGTQWADEYQLKPMGILVAPVVQVADDEVGNV